MNIREAITDRIYGIDLGTTYSCIGYFDEDSGAVVTVDNIDGQLTTPSVVRISPEGEVLVGTMAKNQPDENTIAFVKRKMGESEASFRAGGRNYRPEEISAYILTKLVKDATEVLQQRDKLHHPIKRVVITVPAYFGTAERNATHTAGTIAGLDVVEVINEPTAAALSYRVEQPPTDDVYLVYDLGGGTFDISLIQATGKTLTEIAVKGDHLRGGYDWDKQLLGLLVDKMISSDPEMSGAASDEEWRNKTLYDIENQKKQLSQRDRISVPMQYRNKVAYIEVTRQEFEARTAGLLEGTMEMVEGILDEIKDDNLKPRRVYLVGGSSKMPAVQKSLDALLQRKLGHKVEISLGNPDLAVAKGAAYHAMILRLREIMVESGNDMTLIKQLFPKLVPYITGSTVYRILAHALGFRLQRDDNPNDLYVDFPAKAGASLPLKETKTYFTTKDSQSTVSFGVYEQKTDELSEKLEDNRLLGEMRLEGLGPFKLPKESDLITTIEVSSDGTVTASSIEPKSGKQVKTTFTIEGSMDEGAVKEASDRVKAAKM
jgi:molecular chaperone DnaK (HSP70)